MEPKPVYKTQLTHQIEKLLNGRSDKITRIKLNGRLAAAYAGEGDNGMLTISRSASFNPPSDREIERTLVAFREVSGRAGRPVLLFRHLITEIIENGNGRFHVVRYAVYFGEQGRLFN